VWKCRDTEVKNMKTIEQIKDELRNEVKTSQHRIKELQDQILEIEKKIQYCQGLHDGSGFALMILENDYKEGLK